jgi:sialic acid synthase SpsE
MTFEEIQQIIQQMLSVQRDLQEGQLRIQERQETDRNQIGQILGIQRDLQEGQLQQLDALEKLLVQSERQERIMNQLIGYSITGESDRLDLDEKIRALGVKVKRLEERQQ